MTSLSVCMIVQNSEKTLAIALESLSYVYDELIIVDGGSTDATCDIALSYGAKIIHSPWTGSYSQQRNVYLSHLKTDWFFTIDADEFIDLKTLEFLNFIKLNPDWATTDSYMILRKWISPFSNKHYIISEPYIHDRQSKLLKYNPNLKYEGLIHEGFSGLQNQPIEISGVSIYHLDLLIHSEDDRREKIHNYTKKSLEFGYPPAFIAYLNYSYLPSSRNLQLTALNEPEILPSVKKMLEELQPATTAYFDYLDISHELDIYLIKLSEFIQTVLLIGNIDYTKILSLFVNSIKRHNDIKFIEDTGEIEARDLAIINSEQEIDFDKLSNVKFIFMDEVHKNANLYVKFLISDKYRLLCHQTYGLEQWALFENKNLSNFSQQIIIENVKMKLANFNLKELNYIIFPDWLQEEETIGLELQKVIRALATHPDSEKIVLLINTGNVDTEAVEMFLSGIAMNLLMEEDLDISKWLQISLVDDLSAREWEHLLPFITGRIILQYEDEEWLTKTANGNLKLYNLNI